MKNKRGSVLLYRFMIWATRTVYPEPEIVGVENIPDEPSIIVGNHAKTHGPIISQLYFPGKSYTWCASQVMHLKEVPAYAFEDFWSDKPKYTHWFYHILSYLIAPFAVSLFNHAHTIETFRDTRIVSTFKQTINLLNEGNNIIIFPEYKAPHNHILCNFHDGFINVARLYYRKTKKELSFVPMYIAPNLRKTYLGKPVKFCASAPIEEERQRICQVLMDEITEIACSLPEHKVIPYDNKIPKKHYPSNKDAAPEKTGE